MRWLIPSGLLALFLFAILSVATNPDHTFPMLPELAAIIFLLLFLVFAISKNKDKIVLSSIEKMAICLFVFQVIGLNGLRLYLSQNTYGNVCASAGSFIYQINCWGHLAASIPIASRQYYMHITAMVIGLIAFVFARLDRKHFRIALSFPIIAFILLFFIHLRTRIFGFSPLLPAYFGRSEPYTAKQFSEFFTNHGWVWPYISSAACLGFAALSSISKREKYIGSIIVVLWGYFAIINGQRGATLLWLGLALIAMIGVFFRKIIMIYKNSRLRKFESLRKEIFLMFSVGIVVFGMLVTILVPGLLNKVVTGLGFQELHKSPMTASYPRLKILEEALTMFKESPWFGHGFGSWLQISMEASKERGFRYIFDTAHNLYAQMFVELGVFHAVFILVLIAIGIYIAWKNLSHQKFGRILYIYSLFAFVLMTSVQEVDYIRATYYLLAWYWGTLIAGNTYVRTGVSIHLSKPVLYRTIGLLGFIWLGIFSIFPAGLYGFECRKEEQICNLERWTSEYFSVPVTRGFGKNYYSMWGLRHRDLNLFEMKDFMSSRQLQLKAIRENEYLAVVGKNPSILSRVEVTVNPGRKDGPRILGSRMIYPPYQSTLAVYWGSGIEKRESRWICLDSCFLLVASCHTSDFLSLKLKLSGIGRSLNVSWQKASKDIDLNKIRSAEKLENSLPVFFATEEIPLLIQNIKSDDDGPFILKIDAGSKVEISPGNCDT